MWCSNWPFLNHMPIPGAQDETNPLHLDSMIWEWQMGFKQKKMWSGWITGQPKQLFNLCFYSLDLPEILPKGKTEVFFFLPPALCVQTTCRALLLGRGPHLPCSPGTSTSLDKHFIGFDACLRALLYLKCFLKVGCHLPWVLLWACPISPRFITLETLLAVSIFVNTVWYSVCVCVFKQ